VLRELEGISVEKWQREWEQSTKGRTTKEYFPKVAERLKMEINLTQNFTTIVTGHSKTRTYLHLFKIIETPTCPCGTRDQTTYHPLFECELLIKDRDRLKLTASKANVQPTNKSDLIRQHYKVFTKFINGIPFNNLSVVQNN